MNDTEVKEALRGYALTSGIDMLGFANIDRFENAPDEFHPRNIYPHTKTVIVLGIRVLRGLMESLDEGMHIPYNAHGYGGINEWFMRDARQKVACWLEDLGHSAVPVIQWTGTPHQEPIMCHRTAAVAAGLGEVGWSKILLTKKFGPLQRFGIVLTDADLPSDPLQVGQICDKCMACVRGCPGGAISRKEGVTVTIEGVPVTHAKVDMFQCTRAHHGGIKATHPRPPADFDTAAIDKKYEELRKNVKDETEAYRLGCAAAGEVQAKYPHALFGLVGNLTKSCAYCGAAGCFRACLEHLEARGLLDRQFVNQYRAVQGKDSAKPACQKAVRQAGGEEVYTE
jgi:epoxyqueuosine reductase